MFFLLGVGIVDTYIYIHIYIYTYAMVESQATFEEDGHTSMKIQLGLGQTTLPDSPSERSLPNRSEQYIFQILY